MDCARFQEILFVWLDGELAEEDAVLADTHVAQCAPCRDAADQERKFEQRMRKALLADAEGAEIVARTLAELGTSPMVGPARPPARVFRLVAPLAAVAASLLIALYGAWFYCIGPFECGYLQALERAADAPARPTRAAALLEPDARALIEQLGDGPRLTGCEPPARSVVPVQHAPGPGLRFDYITDSGTVTVVCCRSGALQPSFRREFEHGGKTWWRADENGRRLIAFIDDRARVLYCIVGGQDEATLLEVAEAVRSTVRK